MFSLLGRRCIVNLNKNYLKILSTEFINNCDKFKISGNLNYVLRFKNSYLPAFNEGSFSSRYHPPSAIEFTQQKIKENLNGKSIMSFEEWSDFKNELLTIIDFLTEVNFSSIVMNCLWELNEIDLAHSFMKYLDNANIKPNHLTYLIYMALCGKNVETCGQEVILDSFKKIKFMVDGSSVLDYKRVTCLIHGLCATELWRDSFEYLKKLPLNPSMEIRNALACAAVKNNDERLAWELVTKWLKGSECPSDKVFEQFMLYALRLQKKDAKQSDLFILKLFSYIQSKDFIMSQTVAKLVEKYFRCYPTKWNVSYSKVSREGECNVCQKQLKLAELSDEEFICLRNSFLERSLKKSDLFINTTHKEFQNYIKYIEHNKPFHIVLDGLNAAHCCPEEKSRKNLAHTLLRVVRKLSASPRKILILGRHHMKRWPQPIMKKISEKAEFFFTHNISQDDPFVVYAALASGPRTLFLSMDLMRDHIARLDDPKLIQLFKKWQQSHQIFLLVDENKSMKFIAPLKHSISLQGDMSSGWHIPFDDKIILDTYEELNNWLCIQKINR